MIFSEGFTPRGLITQLVKMTFFTIINVALINYASSRAIEQGDTDLFNGIILLISMVGSVALLLDSLKGLKKSFAWNSALYTAFCAFNVYYFFKIYSCCVPSIGSMT